MLSPADIMKKWKTNTSGATESYKAGIRGVTESPTEKAAASAEKYMAGVQRAYADGSYVDGLRAVSLQQWKDAAIDTGAARLSSGVQKGEQKMQMFLQEFIPAQRAITQEVRAMPSMTPEQREERMLAQIRKTRALSFRRRGR